MFDVMYKSINHNMLPLDLRRFMKGKITINALYTCEMYTVQGKRIYVHFIIFAGDQIQI